ncbi:MAG: hypothetical protein ACYTAO_09400, partial [Planctomycetota bacterium]
VPYVDLRRYLHFLFSDNPRTSGCGIFVSIEDGKLTIDFKGRFDFGAIKTDEATARKFREAMKRLRKKEWKTFAERFCKSFNVEDMNEVWDELDRLVDKLRPQQDDL